MSFAAAPSGLAIECPGFLNARRASWMRHHKVADRAFYGLRQYSAGAAHLAPIMASQRWKIGVI
jgi:hypothetical protein